MTNRGEDTGNDRETDSRDGANRSNGGAAPRRPRLLVVEDRTALRRSYTELLHQSGYATSEAGSLREATYLVVQPHMVFDGAILDLVLTDGSGADLIQPLMNRTPLCRSMVVTGNEEAGPPVSLAQIGAEAYVHKPIDPRTFLRAVKATLKATTKWRRAARQIADDDTINVEPISDDALMPLAFDVRRAVARLKQIGDLTPAQVLTASRLLWGDSDKEIARYLGCSDRTARHHVHTLLRRLGIPNRASLLRVLLEDAGILDPKEISTGG